MTAAVPVRTAATALPSRNAQADGAASAATIKPRTSASRARGLSYGNIANAAAAVPASTHARVVLWPSTKPAMKMGSPIVA
jgi:hypothetical protein